MLLQLTTNAPEPASVRVNTSPLPPGPVSSALRSSHMPAMRGGPLSRPETEPLQQPDPAAVEVPRVRKPLDATMICVTGPDTCGNENGRAIGCVLSSPAPMPGGWAGQP